MYCMTESATERMYQDDSNKKIDVEIEFLWMACCLMKEKQMKSRVMCVLLIETQLSCAVSERMYFASVN